MALISQADLQARLGRTLTAEEASAFIIVNAAFQAYLEKQIGSSVEVATAATRYYDGGVQHLAIDPCTDVSAVKLVDDDQVVQDTLDTSDYTLEPINRTMKTMIRNRGGKFYRGINNLAVTAKFSIFGDAAILAIVKDALLQALASEIDNSSNILRETIEGYTVEYASTEARNALSSIRYLFPEV